MSTATRIYAVLNKNTGENTLVEAATPAQAVKLVVSAILSVSVPSATEVLNLVEAGAHVHRLPAPVASVEPALAAVADPVCEPGAAEHAAGTDFPAT